MNRDDIIRMAREAGFNTDHDLICIEGWEISPYMQRFAALVAAHEREMCAQMCDVLAWNAEYASEEIKIAALAIRERGKHGTR